MECNRYVEEKVGETESREFREHFAECAGCRRDVEELQEVRDLYRAASVERYPGAVPRARRGGWGAWVPAAAAAAVLVSILAFILAGPKDGGKTPETPEPPPSIFVRVPLQPWGGEQRISIAMDTLWRDLARLEGSPR